MIVKCFRIDENLELKPFPVEEVAEVSKATDEKIWLDLMEFESGELEEWLSKLGISDLARKLCLEARDRAAFYPLREEILLVVPFPTASDDPHETDYVMLLCRENLLLTLHSKTLRTEERLPSLILSGALLPKRSIPGLVSSTLMSMSLLFLQRTFQLRTTIINLTERMDREPETIEAEDLINARSDLLALGVVVSDQLPSIQALSRTTRPFFRLEEAQEYLNCALMNLQAADGWLDYLDQNLSTLRSGIQMYGQEKTNRRLGMLTILSAIFMPMTLLAAIWGMNFEVMPELKYRYSYPMAIGAMVLIGVGMYRFFRKRGWFG